MSRGNKTHINEMDGREYDYRCIKKSRGGRYTEKNKAKESS